MAKGNKRNSSSHADLPGDDAPVDIAAVRRDDAFIEALSGNGNVETQTPEQYELALVLADWRSSIVSKPMPEGPNLDEVVAAIEKNNRAAATRGRLRLLRPIAGAAAAIAVVMGGATIFSYNAEPGDPLWNVKEVVFSKQADSTVAKIDTTSQLEQAEKLIASGDARSAQAVLATASARADDVRDENARGELQQWRERLSNEVEKMQPEAPAATPRTTAQPPAPGGPGSQLPIPGLPGPETAPWQDLLPTDLQILPSLPPVNPSPVPDPSTVPSPADPPVDPSTVPSPADPPVDTPSDPPTKPADPTIMQSPGDSTVPTSKSPTPPPPSPPKSTASAPAPAVPVS